MGCSEYIDGNQSLDKNARCQKNQSAVPHLYGACVLDFHLMVAGLCAGQLARLYDRQITDLGVRTDDVILTAADDASRQSMKLPGFVVI